MSSNTRNLENKSEYYDALNTKQQRNWRRNNRKSERNEELKAMFPPYSPSSNVNVIHLHYQTEVATLEELIKKAEQTGLYALDTESQHYDRQNHGALIQIQMVHSISYSTILLIEVNFLPNSTSVLYQKMKQLWSIIFSNGHEILSWGPYEKEMENFDQLELIKSGKSFFISNMQLQFQDWCDGKAHPEMERRVHNTDFVLEIEASDDDDIFSYETQGVKDRSKKNRPTTEWSLQEAIAKTFNKFLDKTETLNYWQCGIDLNLGTWQKKLFSKGDYDQQIEQQQRLIMVRYAVHDCTTLPELYVRMYPDKVSICQETTTTTTTYPEPTTESSTTKTSISTPTLTTTASRSIEMINDYVDQLSDVEQKLIKALQPKFNQPPPSPTVTSTTEKSPEEKKKERQRKKNEKFKLKKKNNPRFQNKMVRPIYGLYDYQKIRAQLADDNIFPTHQTTINRRKTQVMLVFRSNDEVENAKLTVRSNYFSRKQYDERWSGR